MISSMKIVQRFAAITKVNPGSTNPGDEESTPEDIEQQTENIKDQTKALKKFEKVKKDFDKAKKEVGLTAAEDPNDDPQELYNQALPLLRKMGVSNFVDKSRTELIPGKTEGENSMYKVTLRRNAVLDGDTISRINRVGNDFESMNWTAQAIEMHVWAPYKAPEVEGVPEAGAPTTP